MEDLVAELTLLEEHFAESLSKEETISFSNLPYDIIFAILHVMDHASIVNLSLASKAVYLIVRSQLSQILQTVPFLDEIDRFLRFRLPRGPAKDSFQYFRNVVYVNSLFKTISDANLFLLHNEWPPERKSVPRAQGPQNWNAIPFDINQPHLWYEHRYTFRDPVEYLTCFWTLVWKYRHHRGSNLSRVHSETLLLNYADTNFEPIVLEGAAYYMRDYHHRFRLVLEEMVRQVHRVARSGTRLLASGYPGFRTPL
jgi:hypothetical protein